MRARSVLIAVVMFLSATSAIAEGWLDIPVISSTLGMEQNRLCAAGVSPTFGCTDNAPYLDPDTGNVGIGTTAPQTELEVAGTISATDLYVNGEQITGSGTDRIVSGTTNILAHENSAISVTVAGADVMRINSNGYTVVGGSMAAPGTVFSNPANFRSGTLLGAAQDGDAFIGVSSKDNSGKAGIAFRGAGNRGEIYGEADYDLHIRPNDQYSVVDVVIAGTAETNGVNVGVNTATPSANLDVSGTARVAGDTEVAGTISATAVKVSGSVSDVCTASNYGLIRRNPTTNRVQICLE